MFSKANLLCGLALFYLVIQLLPVGTIPFGAQQVQAAGSAYFVAKDGSDNNPGTEAKPWLTIQKAARTAVAGDTVKIKAGTYTSTQITMSNSGSAGNYITFQNYANDVVNINVNDSSYTGLWTNSRSYLKFIGLKFIGVARLGIDVDGGSNVTIQNCYFTNSLSSGIQAVRTDHLIIDGCECSGTNTNGIYQDEIVSLYAVTNFEVKSCRVHNPLSPRIGIDAKNGCSNGIIHHNEVYNCPQVGIYIDGYGSPSSNINVYSNNVHNNGNAGLVVNSESSPAAQTNINFYNNLVYNNHSGFAVWATPDFSKTYTLIGNTFYHNSGIGEVCLYGTTGALNVNCVIRNNIFLGNGGTGKPLIYFPGYANGGVTIDHNLFYDAAGYYSSNKYGTNYIQANPLLINPISNFNISSNSPAKDSGSSVKAPSTDYAGTTRPSGAGIEIGAYEYAVNNPSPTPVINPSPTPVINPSPTPVINIGSPAVETYESATSRGGYTYINRTNPANGAGIVTTVKVFFDSAPNGVVKFGIFRQITANHFTCVANTGNLGPQTAGYHAFTVSLACRAGDYIGCYVTSTYGDLVAYKLTGGAGHWIAVGDQTACVGYDFGSPNVNTLFSLY